MTSDLSMVKFFHIPQPNIKKIFVSKNKTKQSKETAKIFQKTLPQCPFKNLFFYLNEQNGSFLLIRPWLCRCIFSTLCWRLYQLGASFLLLQIKRWNGNSSVLNGQGYQMTSWNACLDRFYFEILLFEKSSYNCWDNFRYMLSKCKLIQLWNFFYVYNL